MTDERIRQFWDARAADGGVDDVEVTHSDVWQRWLEIETIRQFLRPEDRLLDVGCGSGYTTQLIAPSVREAVGIDSSPGMVDRGNRAAAGAGVPARFAVGDVLALGPEQVGTFDVVLSSRCLINLASWDDQQRAIRNIASVIEPGGRFLFLEGSADGRARLNGARTASGLEPMPPVWHNVDFVEDQLLAFLAPMFTVEARRHFGVYDFVARIVHPLVVAPQEPQYGAHINEVGARLALQHQQFRELSRVLFLVLVRNPS
jgi:SAM-dependent methyltransferase